MKYLYIIIYGSNDYGRSYLTKKIPEVFSDCIQSDMINNTWYIWTNIRKESDIMNQLNLPKNVNMSIIIVQLTTWYILDSPRVADWITSKKVETAKYT